MQFFRAKMILNKKNCQLQSFITVKYLQLLCWWLFHTRSFKKLKKINIKMISSCGFSRNCHYKAIYSDSFLKNRM
jgi:hypothetical protein